MPTPTDIGSRLSAFAKASLACAPLNCACDWRSAGWSADMGAAMASLAAMAASFSSSGATVASPVRLRHWLCTRANWPSACAIAACACCTSTCVCRDSTRAFSPAFTRRIKSCVNAFASKSLRLFKSSSTWALAALTASARSSPASLSLDSANWPSKPNRWAATSAWVAARTPRFQSGNSISASSSRKPSFLLSLSVRCARAATGSPNIQLPAAFSLAASSLRRLSKERDWLLISQAASSACLSVGGWLGVWASALEARQASQSVVNIALREYAEFLE